MKWGRRLWSGMAVVLAGLSVCAAARAAAPEGETYYTRANIWYEDAAEPIIINYHRGTILPAGSKVKIDAFKKSTIKFTADSGVTLTLENAPKYSTITTQELFDRYFSKENVVGGLAGFFGKFSGAEKENVKKGTIAEGMSREAVLMAYGYPPSHRTPDLKSDTWAYWDSRFISFRVVFKDNRVSLIERGPARKKE